MDFLIRVIDKELKKCESAEKYEIDLESFVRDMENHGEHVSLASKDVKKEYIALRREEDRLKNAKHDYSISREITGKDVIPIRKHILPAYKQHLKVRRGPVVPLYEMLSADIQGRNSDISCVVDDGKRIFDPRVPEKWVNGNYQEGDKIDFYLHNLRKGHNHNLMRFVTFIGPTVDEEKTVRIYHPEVLRLLKRENLTTEDLVRNEKYGNAEKGFFAYVVPENQYGVHARPAALIVKAASRFDCDVTLYNGDVMLNNGEEKGDGKSIMGVMALGAGKGTNVVLSVLPNGHKEQAEHCIDALINLFEIKFNED